MLIHWIWLANCPGKDWEKVSLLRQAGDPETLCCMKPQDMARLEGLRADARAYLEAGDLSDARRILEKCEASGIRIVTLEDPAYPYRLKNIVDPPLVLYYKGNLPDFEEVPVIGIVGTRKASAYGMQTAFRMGYQIAKCGGMVVSGLASGVDGMAMSGALSAGMAVVGVLGCGVDIVYPKSNKELFRDTERYGCILSEYPPGTAPAKWNFPRRNRIISGLSCGVLVVEAPEKSGALITARQAADQGRDVFVVPGNIDMDSCVGSNHLLREGAIPVSCGWDVLSEYEMLYPDKLCRDDSLPRTQIPEEKNLRQGPENPREAPKESNLKKKTGKKVIDKEPSAPYSDVNDILPGLSEDAQCIARLLSSGPRLVDDVIAETGLTTGKVLGLLTMLELKKVIVRHPGKRIGLK